MSPISTGGDGGGNVGKASLVERKERKANIKRNSYGKGTQAKQSWHSFSKE